MGMDVFGKAAKREVGEYFRASIWSWPGIARVCEKVAPDLTGKIKYFHSNDGDGLGDEDSVALADRLDEALAGPCGARLQKSAALEKSEWPTPERMAEFSAFLRNSGGFKIL